MKKNVIIIVIVMLVIVLGGGVLISRSNKKTDTSTSNKTASTPAATEDPNTVVMKDLDYQTKTLTVKKGTTVTWKNNDTASHTITFNDTANSAMDGPLTAPGKTYQHTFDTAGTFAYHCMPHPFMKGTIVVTD